MQIILDSLHVEGVCAATHHILAKEYFNTDLIAELENVRKSNRAIQEDKEKVKQIQSNEINETYSAFSRA